jgi:outer membrane protein W
VKPAPTHWFFWISRWAGAGFLYCWFIAEMVGETRPYTLVLLDLSLGGAGFLYCWFMTEMVGETRPYTSVLLDLSLGGRVFYIVGL